MLESKLKSVLKNHDGLNFNLLHPEYNKRRLLNKALLDHGVKNVSNFASPRQGRDYVPSEPVRQPLIKSTLNYVNRLFKPGQTKADKAKYIYILVDNDADGFTSAAFMYKYIYKAFGVKSQFVFTYGKNHGIKSANVKSKLGILKNVGLLIIPDASLSTSDISFLKQWKIPYLIIDHHDLNHQKYDRVHKLHIFNNQWDDTRINREFTGVGMAYLFCKMLDKTNGKHFANDFLYLLSIGQVGDVSDIADPEIRHYVLEGFRQMTDSELLKLTTDTKRLSAHQLSFSIIPKINAVCRTGSIKDKRDLMNALVDNEPQDLVKISYRRKSKIDSKFHKHFKDVDHYYLEAKQLNRIKSRQKRAVKKSLKSLKHIYETKSFIVAVDKTGKFKQEEAGLIATQLSNQYQKPTLVLRVCSMAHYYKGSARGNAKVMKNFRRFCLQTQKFLYALGHPQAFGVAIKDTKLKELLDEYKNVDLNDKGIVYNVDKLYLDDVPSKKDIVAFDDNRSLFGGHVKEPVIGFAGVRVKPIDIRFYGSVFTMKAHNLKFIMFNSPKDLRDKIVQHRGDFYFDVVGSPDINRFMKYHYPQVIINNFKIVSPIDNSAEGDDDFGNFYF